MSLGKRNIVLIGMPGVGKSTIGVLLAKVTSRDFVDTDVCIQACEGRRLQDIIDNEGPQAFCRLEERHILSLDRRRSVIATGGSVVYSEPAMRHLAAYGLIVHLDLPLPLIEQRLTNFGTRGVVIHAGQSLRDLYDERQPLYHRWADLTVDARDMNHEEVLAALLYALNI